MDDKEKDVLDIDRDDGWEDTGGVTYDSDTMDIIPDDDDFTEDVSDTTNDNGQTKEEATTMAKNEDDKTQEFEEESSQETGEAEEEYSEENGGEEAVEEEAPAKKTGKNKSKASGAGKSGLKQYLLPIGIGVLALLGVGYVGLQSMFEPAPMMPPVAQSVQKSKAVAKAQAEKVKAARQAQAEIGQSGANADREFSQLTQELQKGGDNKGSLLKFENENVPAKKKTAPTIGEERSFDKKVLDDLKEVLVTLGRIEKAINEKRTVIENGVQEDVQETLASMTKEMQNISKERSALKEELDKAKAEIDSLKANAAEAAKKVSETVEKKVETLQPDKKEPSLTVGKKVEASKDTEGSAIAKWKVLGFSGSKVVVQDENKKMVTIGINQVHNDVKILKIDVDTGVIRTSAGQLKYGR